MQKQSGFTLIELVMVIVILGILAAAALPKFVDFGTEAKTQADAYTAQATSRASEAKTLCQKISGAACADL